MSEDNNEEYFRTLITQPPHSNYNIVSVQAQIGASITN